MAPSWRILGPHWRILAPSRHHLGASWRHISLTSRGISVPSGLAAWCLTGSQESVSVLQKQAEAYRWRRMGQRRALLASKGVSLCLTDKQGHIGGIGFGQCVPQPIPQLSHNLYHNLYRNLYRNLYHNLYYPHACVPGRDKILSESFLLGVRALPPSAKCVYR